MTNETAAFLKLLLQSGMEQTCFSYVQERFDANGGTAGVERALYRCKGDVKRSEAVLSRATRGKRIDYDAVLVLLVEEMRKQYQNGTMTQSAVVSAMHFAARQTTKYTYEPWLTMDQMSDLYCYAIEEKIPKYVFDAAFQAFLTERTTLNEFFAHDNSRKATFRDLMEYEKRGMNRIRFVYNNRVVPAYFAVTILIITAIAIFMSVDEKRFEPLAILCFGILGIITVLLLISVPIVRSKEIELELARYDFKVLPENFKDIYDFFVDGTAIRFDETGVGVGDDFFSYRHLQGELSTSGKLMRVHLGFEFFTEADRYFQIPFCPDSLAMIERFQIKLENDCDLAYLLQNKRQAFFDIYKYGIVRPDLHKRTKNN